MGRGTVHGKRPWCQLHTFRTCWPFGSVRSFLGASYAGPCACPEAMAQLDALVFQTTAFVHPCSWQAAIAKVNSRLKVRGTGFSVEATLGLVWHMCGSNTRVGVAHVTCGIILAGAKFSDDSLKVRLGVCGLWRSVVSGTFCRVR